MAPAPKSGIAIKSTKEAHYVLQINKYTHSYDQTERHVFLLEKAFCPLIVTLSRLLVA